MQLLDFILHIDVHLLEFIRAYGSWVYAILFAIIFVETGLVVMPFLPGDSLLFAAGALAASTGELNPALIIFVLSVAAILGDSLNYQIGRSIGPRVFELNNRFIKQEHLLKTQAFFEKYGGKTIIFARFIPLFRTFVPFIAGASKMNYKFFILFNIIGGILWIASLTLLGFAFGNIPFIKNNFTHLVFGIIILSILPAIFEFIRSKRKKEG